MNIHRVSYWLVIGIAFSAILLQAQSDPDRLASILERPLQTSPEVALQIREYLMQRVTKLPEPKTAEQWTTEASHLRRHLLDDVVFHGWPKDWVNGPPKFEDLGIFQSGNGYRIRKLRYEIVPGFQSVALLYEPEKLTKKVPAILNVNGHDYKLGKASEYKQKRCINFAKHGILALSLEWLGCGELRDPNNKAGNEHWGAAQLDLVGTNAAGLFYLAMRRGLDYLYDRPDVDRARLGMTGLSGGGWQTITLSSLDERISVAVPVAGYASLVSEVERLSDTGDIEQIPTDFFLGVDNAHLTAMRAPRPTLLMYDAEDDCCFRAPLVKPYVYDQVRPYFKIFNKPDNFAWHENTDPGTHNYQLDNRLQAYQFFAKHFRLPPIQDEAGVAEDIKSYDDLVVGLPKSNLTMIGLAKKLAEDIRREPIPSEETALTRWVSSETNQLKQVVRYRPTVVGHAWAAANTKEKGVETQSYRFELDNGLSATGIRVKAITAPDDAPATIILNDEGKKSSAAEVSDRVNRGEQALAVDLLLSGDMSPDDRGGGAQPAYMALLLATLGDRALGIEASQLIAISRWLENSHHPKGMRIECTGIRSQVKALVASALTPGLYREIVVHEGIHSLSYLLDTPIMFDAAPDLFCLDLYKDFDLDRLGILAKPTILTVQQHLDPPISK
ncbi:MAG TPA: acetylxylan esterase [Terriglobales bacterium]|jgi:dienelactone hydrolase